MKNLINLIASIILTITLSFANTPPVVLISEAAVEVVVIEESKYVFESADFNSSDENLSFTTATDIQFVQIFNASGQMEFQLPVSTDNVKINKNLFDKGAYKLGFILEGDAQPHFTQVTIR